ncbi:MAG: TatD family hydrolase [Ignavibacteriales bacterium]|nr:TatD family hydrolase [Ignavibacteriales bacterium]
MAQSYTRNEITPGKTILIVANLEPAKIRGVDSEGHAAGGQDRRRPCPGHDGRRCPSGRAGGVSGLLVDTHAHLSGEEFEGDRDGVVRRRKLWRRAWKRSSTSARTPRSSVLAGGFAERCSPPFLRPQAYTRTRRPRLRPATWRRSKRCSNRRGPRRSRRSAWITTTAFSPRDHTDNPYFREADRNRPQKESKPLIVHVREAMRDALAVLRSRGRRRPFQGVFHCYGGHARGSRPRCWRWDSTSRSPGS